MLKYYAYTMKYQRIKNELVDILQRGANMVARKITLTIAFLLLFEILTACGTENTPVTKSAADTVNPEVTTIPFRITWTDYSGRGEAIQKIVSSYNENNSDGTFISMVGGDEDMDAISALLKSNPETIYVLPYRYVKYFGEQGYLADLTDTYKDAKALFYPKIWDLGTVNGEVYGIPWLGHSMCLLYNKSLLEKAGVDPESITSLDSLVTAMNSIEEKTDAQGIGLVGANSNDVSWMVNQFIYGYGSSLVSDDGKTVTVNNEKSRSALDFYKNILGMHAQSTWTNDTGVEVMNYFRDQKVAFEIQAIWGVTDIQKNGAPFEVGIISLEDIGLCSEVGPMMLAVPAGMSDELQEKAASFIRFLISKDAQEQILNGEYSPEHDTYYPFRTPIRIDMADSLIFRSFPEYLTFIEGFKNPSIDVPVPAWQTIKDELYAPGLHKVMSGELSIDEFLNNIETEGDKILAGQ